MPVNVPTGGFGLKLQIIDAFSRNLTKYKTAVGAAEMKTKGLRSAVQKHAGAIRKMGLATTIAGGAITAAFALAVRTSGKFEQSMANVAAVAGASGDQLKELSMFARKMGADTVFAASEAADAMYFLASAGFGVEKMMKALPGVLNLAAATGGELAEVTSSVVATLNQFELGAADAAKVSNVFAAAIGKSQATMGKLAISMSYAGAGANALGMSLEQTTALLSKIFDIGIDASMAGTQLRMAFVRLSKPTKEVNSALKELGLTYDDVDPKVHNVIDTLELLGDRGMDLTQSLSIFGTRAGATFLKLSQRAGDIDKLTTAITGTDKAAEMADKMINTWQGTLKLLKSAIQEVQLIIGDALLPVLTPMVKRFKDIVRQVGEWMKAHPKLSSMLIKFGAVLGPVLIALGALMMILPSLVAALPMLAGAFAVLTGPVGLTVLAITALVAAFAYFYKTNKEFRGFVDTKILPSLKKIWEGVKTVVSGLKFMVVNWKATWEAARQISDLTFEQIKKTVWKFFTDWSAFKAGLNLFAQFGKSLIMTWAKTWEMVGTILVRALSIVWAPLMKSLQWVADNIEYYFALGIEKARDALIRGINWITSMVFVPMGNFFIDVANKMTEGVGVFINFFIKGMNTVTKAIKPVVDALSWFAKHILRQELPESIQEFGEIAEVEFGKIEKLGKDALTIKIPESTLKEPAKFTARMSEAWQTIKDQYSKIPGDLQKYVNGLIAEWENVTEAAGKFGVAVDWADYAKKLGEVIVELKKAGVDTSALEKKQRELGDTMAMGPMRMKEAWRRANEEAQGGIDEYSQIVEEGLLAIWLFWDDFHNKKGPLSIKEGWIKNNEELNKGLKKFQKELEKGMTGVWLMWDDYHNKKGPMSVKEGWRKKSEETREALKKAAEFEQRMAMDFWLMWDDVLGKKGPLSVKEGWKKKLVEDEKGLKKYLDTMEEGLLKVWLIWDDFHKIKGPLSIKEGWGRNDEAFKAGLKKYDEDMQAGALKVWLFWDDVLNKKGPLSVKEGWAKNNREQAEGLKKYQEELERGLTGIWLYWDNFHNVQGPMSVKEGWRKKLEEDREALKKYTEQQEAVALQNWLMWDDFLGKKGPMSMKEGWRKSNEEALKGMTTLTEAQRKAAAAMKSIWDTFNSAVKSSFSDLFYDFMMGTKKSKDIWQAFCDSMVSSFVKAVADTIAEKLGLDKLFEGNILNLGNLFIGLGNLVVGVFKGIGNIIGGIFGGIGGAVGGALGGTTVVAGQLAETGAVAEATAGQMGIMTKVGLGLQSVVTGIGGALKYFATMGAGATTALGALGAGLVGVVGMVGTAVAAWTGFSYLAENVIGPALRGIGKGLSDFFGLSGSVNDSIEEMTNWLSMLSGRFADVGTEMQLWSPEQLESYKSQLINIVEDVATGMRTIGDLSREESIKWLYDAVTSMEGITEEYRAQLLGILEASTISIEEIEKRASEAHRTYYTETNKLYQETQQLIERGSNAMAGSIATAVVAVEDAIEHTSGATKKAFEDQLFSLKRMTNAGTEAYQRLYVQAKRSFEATERLYQELYAEAERLVKEGTEAQIHAFAKQLAAHEDLTQAQKENLNEILGITKAVFVDTTQAAEDATDEQVSATEDATEDMARSYIDLSQKMADEMRRMKEEGRTTAQDIRNFLAMSANQMAQAFGESTQSMINSLARVPTRIGFDVIGRLHMPSIPSIDTQVFNVIGRYQGSNIPSLQRGIPYVPQTTLAEIHRKEAVLTAPQAERWRAGKGRAGQGGTQVIYERGSIRMIVMGGINQQVDLEKAMDYLARKQVEKMGRL